MLAQNFMTATDLRISDEQKDALVKTLVLLETGKLQYRNAYERKSSIHLDPSFDGYFNMQNWVAEHACGTVACIGGTAELISGVKFTDDGYVDNKALYELFQPRRVDWNAVTPEQAARALRSYLTTGEARWDLAVTIG